MAITPEGARVLGSLVEKQLTTPQQYPLTRNALALACSQSTNREPVMSMDETAVDQALSELKALRLVRFVLPSHGKSVTRFRHVLDEAYGLDNARVALLGVLLLRGPQTPGELRTRTERMARFSSVAEVVTELEVLARPPEPLVQLLPRRPGQKEDRWTQLLATGSGAEDDGAAVSAVDPEDSPHHQPPPHGADADPAEADALATDLSQSDLERRVEMLASEVAALQHQMIEVATALDDLRDSLGG
jgi:uncharacterized protein